MENNLCKICGSEKKKIFDKKILEKYNVSYFECLECGLIQTEKPHWFAEAYSSAITSLDIGLVNRNIYYSNIVEDILYKFFDKKAKFLDFAGGYGMFTRIMRDKGFDYYREDKYCENLFAKHFDITDLSEEERKFELVTAFELMEHIENPFKELDYIFSISDSFLFSTELIPDQGVEDWWYLGTEHGQHISFYTKKSLEKIATKYGKVYYGSGNLHLITNNNIPDIFTNDQKKKKLFEEMKEKILRAQKLESRTWDDFQMVIKKEKR